MRCLIGGNGLIEEKDAHPKGGSNSDDTQLSGHHINKHCCQDQGYSTDLLDPTQVESKNTFSQIQWPVPSINAESVDIFLGEE